MRRHDLEKLVHLQSLEMSTDISTQHKRSCLQHEMVLKYHCILSRLISHVLVHILPLSVGSHDTVYCPLTFLMTMCSNNVCHPRNMDGDGF